MTIDEATINYFKEMRMHRQDDQIKILIESWLEVMYKDHDIDNRDWIYNRDIIVDEFYNAIFNGQDKTTI
jgi:hypothetical protein